MPEKIDIYGNEYVDGSVVTPGDGQLMLTGRVRVDDMPTGSRAPITVNGEPMFWPHQTDMYLADGTIIRIVSK